MKPQQNHPSNPQPPVTAPSTHLSHHQAYQLTTPPKPQSKITSINRTSNSLLSSPLYNTKPQKKSDPNACLLEPGTSSFSTYLQAKQRSKEAADPRSKHAPTHSSSQSTHTSLLAPLQLPPPPLLQPHPHLRTKKKGSVSLSSLPPSLRAIHRKIVKCNSTRYRLLRCMTHDARRACRDV